MAEIFLDTHRLDHYDLFLRIKSLPRFSFQGHTAIVPDEYLTLLGQDACEDAAYLPYQPEPFLFDYQQAVASLSIRKRKFAVFARCGLGKTLIYLSYARYVNLLYPDRPILIVCPLSVIPQTIEEAERFWPGYAIQQIRAKSLQEWLGSGNGIGITNYEAIRDGLRPGRLCCLILDESSTMKSHYGAWARRLIDLGKGLVWKLCLTGTPAPNDRIEYANHAVFLDQFPTVNSFLARYFVNRGQTGERWELKPHALRPFYRSLSHWCIFLEDPATYGWKDNVHAIPPIHVHIHDVDMSDEQRQAVARLSGSLIGTPGGITKRSKLAQLAKGRLDGQKIASGKVEFIRNLVSSWKGESTIIWCRYNEEQDDLEEAFPNAASIRGATKEAERRALISEFQGGRKQELITKPDVLGFGMNFQIATRHVFNGLWDSSEEYHQAVSRSNRVGSTQDLNVHIVLTEIERAMADNTFAKIKRMQQDSQEQEKLFREVQYAF